MNNAKYINTAALARIAYVIGKLKRALAVTHGIRFKISFNSLELLSVPKIQRPYPLELTISQSETCGCWGWTCGRLRVFRSSIKRVSKCSRLSPLKLRYKLQVV